MGGGRNGRRGIVPVAPWLAALAMRALVGSVYAWGPATHVAHCRLLEQEMGRAVLSAAPTRRAAAAISSAPDAFALGCVYPDIRELAPAGHKLRGASHKHDFAFSLLDRAQTETETAFALGNLAHIAQDTVGQVFYVPRKMCQRRIGYFRCMGLSHEEFVEGMVELYYGDMRRLRKGARAATDQLHAFYAETVAAFVEQGIDPDEVARFGKTFCRLASWERYTARPAGYLLNAAMIPFTLPFSGMVNPFGFRDAPRYLRMANTVFLDLVAKRRRSGWYRHWPVWSRNVQLFGGTQGEPLFKRARCTNGLLLYDAWFAAADGGRCQARATGPGQYRLALAFSCTNDVEERVGVRVMFSPGRGRGRQASQLAAVHEHLRMRLMDPEQRRTVVLPFAAPAETGTVYFEVDMQRDGRGRPELSSLRPGCDRAREANWPPILRVAPPEP